jgi:hypothetical protein
MRSLARIEWSDMSAGVRTTEACLFESFRVKPTANPMITANRMMTRTIKAQVIFLLLLLLCSFLFSAICSLSKSDFSENTPEDCPIDDE